ncbi:RidA family protein [bacterium]|nr:MAG: RidA family protein [bacterium]
MAKEIIHSDKLSKPIGVFSQAVKVPAKGHLIFVSGLTARDPSGNVVGRGDIRAQTRRTLENLRAVLAEAGTTLEDVVKVTVFIRHMERDFKPIHEVRAEFFPNNPPASTMVEVSRLVEPDHLIEIEAIAVIP